MFSIGDKIVHPMHGAGIIESIVAEKIDGTLCVQNADERPGSENTDQ